MESNKVSILKSVAFILLAAAIVFLCFGLARSNLPFTVTGAACLICWAVLYGCSEILERMNRK